MDWNICQSPAPELSDYHFGATLDDGTVTAATLRDVCQRGNPIVEEACRGGMNDFRQIRGITPD